MKRASLCLVAALSLCFSAGCPKKTPTTARAFDADANSGPDGKRSGAVPMELGKSVTDNVDFDKGDRTDWKSVELKGSGTLTVELHWDNPAADLSVDVFDDFGQGIQSSPANSGMPYKKIAVGIQQAGMYFVRIQAVKTKDASDYTVEAKFDGGEAPPPPPPDKDEPSKPKPKHHTPVVKKRVGGSPESGVQGRIVSSYREGGSLVLHLDKGTAAGVAVGQNGWILEGPNGASPLDGGTFQVTQVIDDSRSIAKTNIKSLSKNTRVSINTGR